MVSRRGLLGMFAGAALAGPVRADSVSIVATTGMIADAARRLTGLPVKALMGPGIDPHSYRATRSDIVALSRADLVLWHGLHLEAQFEELMADLSRRIPVVAVADSLPRETLLAWPNYPDRPDPHVWFDPAIWSQVIGVIEKTVHPFASGAVEAGVAYRADIATLSAYAHSVLASVPDGARILVTAHDAFSYFGRAYGFEVEGIQGISTESEAGLQRIGALVDLIVARKVPAVFVESSVSDRSVRALIEGAGARGHDLRIGGELYSDAMGAEGSYEGTWLGMVDHNVTTIARALGGQAPETGAIGRLGGQG